MLPRASTAKRVAEKANSAGSDRPYEGGSTYTESRHSGQYTKRRGHSLRKNAMKRFSDPAMTIRPPPRLPHISIIKATLILFVAWNVFDVAWVYRRYASQLLRGVVLPSRDAESTRTCRTMVSPTKLSIQSRTHGFPCRPFSGDLGMTDYDGGHLLYSSKNTLSGTQPCRRVGSTGCSRSGVWSHLPGQ